MKFFLKIILCVLVIFCTDIVQSGEYEDVLQDAELNIENKYKTELSKESAYNKLKGIIDDKTFSEKDKIARIRQLFLQDSHETINEQNAYKLLYIQPLTWTVHSISIAYDIDNTQQILLSGKLLDTQEASSARKNSGTSTISSFMGASAQFSMNADAKLNLSFNPLKLLSSKGSFSAEADACIKGDISKNEQEIWSRERQLALSERFDAMTQVLSDTKISGCHLTFAVTFKNNLEKDLFFDSKSTIPVYANDELILNAMPENINKSEVQILPSKSTTTIKFKGAINNTRAQTLLRFMKNNSPSIFPEQGQLFIYSRDQLEQNVAQNSIAIPTVGVRCGNVEWRIRKVWNNKNVTLKEALLAINSIYNDPVPFELKENECVSVFSMPFADKISTMKDFKPFILFEIDSKIYSSVPDSLLANPVKNDIQIHVIDDIHDSLSRLSVNDNIKHWLFAFIRKSSKKDDVSKLVYAYLLTDEFPELPTDYSMAYTLFSEISKSKDEEIREKAELIIALFKYFGLGTEQDISEAISFLDKIATTSKNKTHQTVAQLFSAIIDLDLNVTPEDKQKGYETLLKVDSSLLDSSLLGIYSLYMSLYYFHFDDGGTSDYSKAIPFLTKAAKLGIPNATFLLACCYYDGTGVDIDYNKAFQMLQECTSDFNMLREKQICNINDGMLKCFLSSLVLLGECHEKGHGTDKNLTKAIDLYKKAADLGDAEGQWRYAFAILRMIPLNKADENSFSAKCYEYLFKAAKQKHPKAQATLAELILSDPYSSEDDKKTAFSILYEAMDQGELEAFVVYADCLSNGWGMEQDEIKAFELYQATADLGHVGAIRVLGIYYLVGKGGVKKDAKLGLQYIVKAANDDDPMAQFIYGSLLVEGDEELGILKDVARGNFLINSAAEQGCEPAIEYKEEHKKNI